MKPPYLNKNSKGENQGVEEEKTPVVVTESRIKLYLQPWTEEGRLQEMLEGLQEWLVPGRLRAVTP